jgi:hypothetical protein
MGSKMAHQKGKSSVFPVYIVKISGFLSFPGISTADVLPVHVFQWHFI